jgi:hypothetical protein
LLHATVSTLHAEISRLGETVAFDVKHLYAWVKENNLRAYVSDRFASTKNRCSLATPTASSASSVAPIKSKKTEPTK